MAVAACQHRQTKAFPGKKCLQIALEMPAREQHCINAPRSELFADLRRVAAGEAVEAGPLRGVAQKDLPIPGKQIDIPFEADAEAGLRLVLRRGAMCEEHGQIEAARQFAKQRSEERRVGKES